MISTHILDTSLGSPGASITVSLELEGTKGWNKIAEDKTNSDGRISFNCPAQGGVYRITFFTEDYFKGLKQESFFQNPSVVFKISNTSRKYHIPLLLNPYSYSTYRGS